MFNPILQENFQGRKHPGSCAFAEPDLLRYRKPRSVIQKFLRAIKIPMIVTTIMTKIMTTLNYIKEIVKGAPNDTPHQTDAHPKTSPRDCDGLRQTNVQWHMVFLSIL